MKRSAAVALAWLALASLAVATTIIPMSLEEMTQAADCVVEGQAGRSWSAWNAEHTFIYTYTTFQVSRALKGAPAQTLTVKQLGGSADGYTQKVSGVRALDSGENALLFLRPSAAGDGTMVVVGLMQGHFRIYQPAQQASTAVVNITGTLLLKEAETRIAKVVPR